MALTTHLAKKMVEGQVSVQYVIYKTLRETNDPNKVLKMVASRLNNWLGKVLLIVSQLASQLTGMLASRLAG